MSVQYKVIRVEIREASSSDHVTMTVSYRGVSDNTAVKCTETDCAKTLHDFMKAFDGCVGGGQARSDRVGGKVGERLGERLGGK